MTLALPPAYLLPTHFSTEEFRRIQDKIPTLTHDITEAQIILGKVNTRQRALFELRSRQLWTEEVNPGKIELNDGGNGGKAIGETPQKRRKIDNTKGHGKRGNEIDVSDSSQDTDTQENNSRQYIARRGFQHSIQSRELSSSPPQVLSSPRARSSNLPVASSEKSRPTIAWGDTIKVVRLAWFMESLAAGHLISISNYVVYEGRPTSQPIPKAAEPQVIKIAKRRQTPKEILTRAKADASQNFSSQFAKRIYSGGRSRRNQGPLRILTRPPHLVHQTTSELDSLEDLPPIPAYLHTTYSCQRPTPLNPVNETLISQLKKIRTARVLLGDEIGVRAYSTAIASLAAYPNVLKSVQEVLRLPGCDQKIAFLFQEWKGSGHIAAVDEIDSDSKMQVLLLFYEIWGVGAVTAREFYSRGWRDLDDIVEYGWLALSRVQQIGVKYYDEFQVKIPRAEVEAIASTIFFHANKLRPGYQMCIVGGYRRGKDESGDVDVIISHPDEAATLGFIQDIVLELENENWITHTLLLSLANSERNQTPVSWKGDSGRRTSGFDTLDKALLVWQDPDWLSRVDDLRENPNTKNPNTHRRVDIIVSPWKTVGCAVAGWTSGTTFQRDMRRYAKKVRDMKFDSSGIRSREDGRWVDLEGVGGKANDMLTAERKVFEGLGLEWREPSERCSD